MDGLESVGDPRPRNFIAPYSKDFLRRLLSVKEKRKEKESIQNSDFMNSRAKYNAAFQVSKADTAKIHHSLASFDAKYMKDFDVECGTRKRSLRYERF